MAGAQQLLCASPSLPRGPSPTHAPATQGKDRLNTAARGARRIQDCGLSALRASAGTLTPLFGLVALQDSINRLPLLAEIASKPAQATDNHIQKQLPSSSKQHFKPLPHQHTHQSTWVAVETLLALAPLAAARLVAALVKGPHSLSVTAAWSSADILLLRTNQSFSLSSNMMAVTHQVK